MLQPDVNTKDHIRGSLPAPVIIVEYGDYQCPHCAHAHHHVRKLEKHFTDKLAFVFRNFPLTEIHDMAFAAAMTAEAAGKKNLYWQMHDAIFEQQDKLGAGVKGLVEIAKNMGLSAAFLQKEWVDKALETKVNDDFENGIMSGVNGTPTFFINGQQYTDAPEYTEMMSFIEGILSLR